MNKSKLQSHLEELRKKHRALDDDIINLQKGYNVHEELRRLKTEKLWLKDEIFRIEEELLNEGVNTNGYH
jgi:hypothetical protein